MSVSIREGYSTDAPSLAILRWEFRVSLSPATEVEADFLVRCERWMRLRLDDPRWRVWIAETEHVMVGNVWIEFFEKMPNPIGEPERHAYLTNFYVKESERGQGVGTRLLEAAIAECERVGTHSIILWPTARSTPLYQRLGFTSPDRLLEKHFTTGAPQPALIKDDAP